MDLVVGSEGEIGSTLFQLLKIRNFKLDGFDLTNRIDVGEDYSAVHL